MEDKFIRKDGKVINCQSNISKMNILEYGRYFGAKEMLQLLVETFYEFCASSWSVIGCIIGFLLFLLSPFWVWIKWHFIVKTAKRDVEIWGKK